MLFGSIDQVGWKTEGKIFSVIITSSVAEKFCTISLRGANFYLSAGKLATQFLFAGWMFICPQFTSLLLVGLWVSLCRAIFFNFPQFVPLLQRNMQIQYLSRDLTLFHSSEFNIKVSPCETCPGLSSATLVMLWEIVCRSIPLLHIYKQILRLRCNHTCIFVNISKDKSIHKIWNNIIWYIEDGHKKICSVFIPKLLQIYRIWFLFSLLFVLLLFLFSFLNCFYINFRVYYSQLRAKAGILCILLVILYSYGRLDSLAWMVYGDKIVLSLSFGDR